MMALQVLPLVIKMGGVCVHLRGCHEPHCFLILGHLRVSVGTTTALERSLHCGSLNPALCYSETPSNILLPPRQQTAELWHVEFVQLHLPISLGGRNPPHEAQEFLFETASVLTATAEIHTKVMLPKNCPGDRARGKGFSYCSMDDLPQTAFLLLPRHTAKAISILICASCSAVLKLCLGMAY